MILQPQFVMPGGAPAASEIITEGLVARWEMSDGSGSIVTDSSGNGRNLMLSNMGSENWVSGPTGGALDFDGINERLIGGSGYATFVSGTNDLPFSVCAFVNMDAAVGFRLASVTGTSTADTWEWYFGITITAQLSLALYGNGSSSGQIKSTTDSTLSSYIGQWVHVAATYDGSASYAGINLYSDGYYVDQTKNIQNTYTRMKSTGSALNIGAFGVGTAFAGFANGRIGEARLYNRELSAAEVLSISQMTG